MADDQPSTPVVQASGQSDADRAVSRIEELTTATLITLALGWLAYIAVVFGFTLWLYNWFAGIFLDHGINPQLARGGAIVLAALYFCLPWRLAITLVTPKPRGKVVFALGLILVAPYAVRLVVNPVFNARTGEAILACAPVSTSSDLDCNGDVGSYTAEGIRREAVTPVQIQRYNRQKAGLYPKRIDANDLPETAFFNTITGQTVVWLSPGTPCAHAFDGPGFDPDTDRELVPATPDMRRQLLACLAQQQALAEAQKAQEQAARDQASLDQDAGPGLIAGGSGTPLAEAPAAAMSPVRNTMAELRQAPPAASGARTFRPVDPMTRGQTFRPLPAPPQVLNFQPWSPTGSDWMPQPFVPGSSEANFCTMPDGETYPLPGYRPFGSLCTIRFTDGTSDTGVVGGSR